MKNGVRWFALLGCSLLICALISGCAGPAKPNVGAEGPEIEENIASHEETKPIEVDPDIFNVEITVPADLLEEGMTQEKLDALVAESKFRSATLNEDGSATYIMTKAQHREMMAELRDSITSAMEDMIDPEVFPTFVSVTANDNYSEFTVVISAEEVGFTESFSVLSFYLLSGMYNTFNGTPADADDVVVKFVSADTNEIIHEAHSADIGK